MNFFSGQNPGIGGLEELTPSEELFIMNLVGLSYQQGDLLYHNGSSVARLPADGGKYLKSNGAGQNPSWETVSVSWGAIAGTLSDQTDLSTALSGKSDTSHDHTGVYAPALGADDNYVTDAEKVKLANLSGTNSGDNATNTQYSGLATSKQDTLVSGTNIKTVNGNSLLGSGDVSISSAVAWGDITGTLSSQTDLQTALDGKVDENVAIVGATKTKVTYDAKGLVTAGADATTADIADSSNKRYVTDAQLTVIGNTSGTNTGDNAVNSNYSGLVSNATHTGDATGSTALTVVKIQGKDFPTLSAADDQKYPKYDNGTGAFVMTAIAGGGNVSNTGTPVNNQIAVWTDATTVEGDSALTFDTTTDKLSTTTSGVVETGTIELGHASDTTLSRPAAGLLAVEGKTLLSNTTTAGIGNTPTASGTTAITHNLGRTPTIIRIYSGGGFTSNAAATPTTYSMGIWNSSGNFCIYQGINGTTTLAAASSNTFAIYMITSAGNLITGVIQNVGATTFDIVWTETGTHTRGVYLWECQ